MTISRILLHKAKEWVNYNPDICKIKMIKTKCSRCESLHLVYNNDDTTDKIEYICEQCNQIKQTLWSKYQRQQLIKGKDLCRLCSIHSEENKKNISEKTKQAMATEEVRKNHSEAQRRRFQRPEEREKSKQRSTEIMARPGMREYVSQRTKKAYDENAERYEYDLEYQNNQIEGHRRKNLNHTTKIQKVVSDFLKSTGLEVIDEYSINIWNDKRFKKRYLLSDMYLPQYNTIIEVLGNYWHLHFIEKLRGQEVIANVNGNSMHDVMYRRDLLRDEIYNELGYKVIYFIEDELKDNMWHRKLLKRIKEEENI